MLIEIEKERERYRDRERQRERERESLQARKIVVYLYPFIYHVSAIDTCIKIYNTEIYKFSGLQLS